MSYRAIIVDDEPLARNRMQRLLSGFDGVEVIASAEDGIQAVTLTLELEPDLLFLDIEMPKLNGLQAAKQIYQQANSPPAIIFCTAYDQFAVDAFDTSAVAYLLKPVAQEQLQSAVEKASKLSQLQINSLPATQGDAALPQRYLVNVAEGVRLFDIDQILYFRSEGKQTIVGLADAAEQISDDSLRNLEQRFTHHMLRVHRNALVNVSFIRQLYKDEAGQSKIKLRQTKQEFSVSRRHLGDVKKRVKSSV